LGLNKKVITILEGESLVNDASALIAYRYAVTAVTTGTFIFWKAGLQFLLVAGVRYHHWNCSRLFVCTGT
jgi:CPA1 family monovalent cation:H+ antiporter